MRTTFSRSGSLTRLAGFGKGRVLALAAVLPLWWLACWQAADTYFLHRLAQSYHQESDQADRHLASLVGGYERIINVRVGMPQMLARQTSLAQLLIRLGPQAPGASLPYEERKRLWTQNPELAAINRQLKSDAALLGLAALGFTDASGNNIAASNAGTSGSYVGVNYADRDYFPLVASGHPGYRITIGKQYGAIGAAFFAPIMDKDRFLGMMVGRIDLAAYGNWLKPADSFLTDRDGVILLSRDESLLKRAVPNASALKLGADVLKARYHTATIVPLQVAPWGDPTYPELQRIEGREHPVIHRTRTVSLGAEPVIHVLWPFPQLQDYQQGRRNAVLISGVLGTALIALLALFLARRAERRRTGMTIAEQERQFRTLANNSPDNILRFDTSARCIYANRHAQLANPDGKNPVGLGVEELDTTDDRRLTLAVHHVLETGEHDRTQIDIGTPEGQTQTYEVRFIPERGDYGGLIGVLAIGRDITGLKRNEAMLEAQNLLLAQHREQLEQEVSARTRELTAANEQLSLKSYALNQVREAVFLVDQDARVLYVNKEACRSLGYSEAELLSMTVMDIDNSVTLDLWHHSWARFCESGSLLIESVQHRKDGTRLTVEVHGTHVRYQGQSYNLALVRDITERKRMEKALDDERRLFIGGPNVAFKWKAEPGWPVEYVSPNVKAQFGYRPEDFTSARIPYSGIIHPADLDRVIEEVRQYTDSAAACFEQEYRIRRADGDYRWIYDFTAIVRDATGQATGYHGHLMDITERKLAEQSLRESEEKYRTLIDKIQTGVVVHGADTRILISNPVAQRILGLTEDQMQGTAASDPRWHIVREDGRQATPEEYPVPRVLSSGEAIRDWVLGVPRNGGKGITWVLVNADPIHGKDEEITQVVVTFIDITARKNAEAALAAREREFRTLAESIPDNIVRYDREGRILYVNPALERTLGIPRQEVLGTFVHDHMDLADFQPLAKAVNDVLATGQSTELEQRLTDPQDGSPRVHHVRVFAEHGPDGEVVGALVLGRDITEQARMEEALRTSEQEFRTLAESLPDNIVRYDRSMQTVYLNPVLERTLGAAAETMIGHTIREYHSDGSFEQYAQAVEQVLTTGQALEIEQQVGDPKSGAARLHQIRIVPERGPHGDVIGALAIGRDVTEEKQMENALRASEQEFRTLAENIPDVIIRYDTHSRKIYLNTAATRFIGVQSEELLGKTPLETPPENRAMPAEIYYEQLRQTLETGSAREIETVLESEGRDKRVFNLRFIDERNEQGKIIGALMVGHDITKIKKAEEELERYQQHLEDLVTVRTKELALARDAAEGANRAKSVFLANMSHELRTPLNAILGFAELMERDEHIPSPQRQNLGIINRSGRHLLALINDILEISKIEAGRLELLSSDCDLTELLESVAEPLRLRARQRNLTLLLRVGPDVPRYISTDVGKLRQILINLISNAVKYTEQGGVEVLVSATPATGDQYQLEFVISDTGIGIPAGEMESIFQPFYQTEQGARLGEGTGLGLAISRQYATLMRGELLAASDLGHGSVFTLRLTVSRASGDTAVVSARRPVSLAPGEPSRRILIVEDQPDNQSLLEQVLRQAGFETRIAANGEEAIACFQDWHPDMIWMDMRLPVLDGYEATRRIRQLPQGKQVKIAAITASVFKENRGQIVAAGCDDVLAKPVDIDRLFATMERLLGVRFRYEEEFPAPSPENPAIDLAGLLPKDCADLCDAARRLDVEATTAAIGRIRQQQPELAERLQALVRAYQYDRIASLCHQIEEKHHG